MKSHTINPLEGWAVRQFPDATTIEAVKNGQLRRFAAKGHGRMKLLNDQVAELEAAGWPVKS